MDELDLLKIERFVFQLYEYFVSYWVTLGDLLVRPGKVLDTLQETAREPEVPAPDAVQPAAAPPRPRDSKTPAWSPLEPVDQARRRRARQRRAAQAAEAEYVFECPTESGPAVCLPGLFGLFSALTLLGLDWVQFGLLGHRVQGIGVSFDVLQGQLGAMFVTLFCTAQFVDAFLQRRGRTGRPRQIFALCCYGTGFLVPKHASTLLVMLLSQLDDPTLLYPLLVVQLLCLALLCLFWIRGVHRIYGETWRGTIRAAVNAAFGASICYGLLTLLLFPQDISRQLALARVSEAMRQGRYAQALATAESIDGARLPTRQREKLGTMTRHLRFVLSCDLERRWRGMVDVLRPRILGTERPALTDLLDRLATVATEGLAPRASDEETNVVELLACPAGTTLTHTKTVSLPRYSYVTEPRQIPFPADAAVEAERIAAEFGTHGADVARVDDGTVDLPHGRVEVARFVLQRQFAHRIGAEPATIERDLTVLYWSLQRSRSTHLRWLQKMPTDLAEGAIDGDE